ncbi:MAG TPA: HNH endonuclease [Acidimicrobiales bacterium]|nr:HNH endonuclease [Acidimicrobiales bacterium]
MSGSVLAAVVALRDALAGFEPGELSGTDCARLADELAVTEKVCATVRVLAAARAAQAGVHQWRGFKDEAAWLARQSGTTGSQARQALETAQRLADCPDTKEALLAGQISMAQAAEITKAESELQGAERELLPVARHSDLSQLRDRAREHRQAHTDPAELRRRQLELQEFRHWKDREGMVRFAGALPPETGLPLVRKVEAAALRKRRSARVAGEDRRRFEFYAAEALADLVAGAASGSEQTKRPDNVELVLVCDIFAWRRGHTHPGEVCHIIGGGPIPPDVAKELAADAFIKAVLHDGINIHTLKHFGRHLPAALRTALDLGPVPEFSGRACVDCGSRWGLEYDHLDPVANGGPTEYANLEARCYKDHRLKTEQDRKAGLLTSKAARSPNTS